MSHSATIPMFVKPSLRPGVAALAEWLRDHNYSAYATERVLNHVAVTGCLASAEYLDREDEGEATEVFIDALPEVAGDSPAWDREDVFMDCELLALGTHPWPIPTLGGPDDDDRSIPPDAGLVPPELDPDDDDDQVEAIGRFLESLPPISGGAPLDEPEFVPSASDWEDYRSHFDRAECLYGYE